MVALPGLKQSMWVNYIPLQCCLWLWARVLVVRLIESPGGCRRDEQGALRVPHARRLVASARARDSLAVRVAGAPGTLRGGRAFRHAVRVRNDSARRCRHRWRPRAGGAGSTPAGHTWSTERQAHSSAPQWLLQFLCTGVKGIVPV